MRDGSDSWGIGFLTLALIVMGVYFAAAYLFGRRVSYPDKPSFVAFADLLLIVGYAVLLKFFIEDVIGHHI